MKSFILALLKKYDIRVRNVLDSELAIAIWAIDKDFFLNLGLEEEIKNVNFGRENQPLKTDNIQNLDHLEQFKISS